SLELILLRRRRIRLFSQRLISLGLRRRLERVHPQVTPLKRLLFASFLLLFASGLPVGVYAAETVTAVTVEGNSKIEADSILKAVKTKSGSSFSRETVNEDIKAIFALGYFSDVEAEKEAAGGGVKIVFRVKEKPLVSKISIEGAKEVSQEKVKEAITQKPLQILDEGKIGQSKEKIKELYSKEGLGLALVTTEIKPNARGDEAEL